MLKMLREVCDRLRCAATHVPPAQLTAHMTVLCVAPSCTTGCTILRLALEPAQQRTNLTQKLTS